MLKHHSEIIKAELVEGTGAGISLSQVPGGLQTGLDIWFSDLRKRAGPVVELRAHGLKSHQVDLRFGMYSKDTLELISEAPAEDHLLARSLISSIAPYAKIAIDGQGAESWQVLDGTFRMSARIKHQQSANDVDAVIKTSREVIVPMMAAMAELIGYDVNEPEGLSGEMEGTLTKVLIGRRERNPRNRLLCLRLHGHSCKCCGTVPSETYREAGGIIEVHHIQPLSDLQEPREYDPLLDLVPLCPNCHRAVHKRRETPFLVAELQVTMGINVR
jgi:5-methylcytosine-specific restriction protein A